MYEFYIYYMEITKILDIRNNPNKDYYVIFYCKECRKVKIYKCIYNEVVDDNVVDIRLYNHNKKDYVRSIYLYFTNYPIHKQSSNLYPTLYKVEYDFRLYDDKIEALNEYKKIVDNYIGIIKDDYQYYVDRI